jgi:hypothetical protein
LGPINLPLFQGVRGGRSTVLIHCQAWSYSSVAENREHARQHEPPQRNHVSFQRLAVIRELIARMGSAAHDPKRSWSDPSFDHLVSEREECWRQLEAERLSGPEIDHQLEFGRLHHR